MTTQQPILFAETRGEKRVLIPTRLTCGENRGGESGDR